MAIRRLHALLKAGVKYKYIDFSRDRDGADRSWKKHRKNHYHIKIR